MDLGVKPLSSNASWKSSDAVPDQFPAGLRVLVVDDDPTCLRILEKMLKNCLYEGNMSTHTHVRVCVLKLCFIHMQLDFLLVYFLIIVFIIHVVRSVGVFMCVPFGGFCYVYV